MTKEITLRVLVLAAALALIAAGVASPALAKSEGNINGFLGQKSMAGDDWGDLDDQTEFGVESSFGGTDWPILIAVDMLFSDDDSDEGPLDVDARTRELGLGVRKIWHVDKMHMHPYVGVGLALIKAELEFSAGGASVNDEDNEVGPWFGGGIFWRLGSNFNLGLSARYSDAEVSLFSDSFEAGGWHIGATAGFGWPGEK